MLERRGNCQERFRNRGWKRFGPRIVVLLGALCFLGPGPARAQSESNEDLKETVQRLVDQVHQLQSKACPQSVERERRPLQAHGCGACYNLEDG